MTPEDTSPVNLLMELVCAQWKQAEICDLIADTCNYLESHFERTGLRFFLHKGKLKIKVGCRLAVNIVETWDEFLYSLHCPDQLSLIFTLVCNVIQIHLIVALSLFQYMLFLYDVIGFIS